MTEWSGLRQHVKSISATPSAPRSIEEVREIVDEVRKDIWPPVEARKLQLPVDEVYKFAHIGKVFEHMPTSTSARSW